MTTFALTLVLGLAFAQEPGDEPPADETAVSADRPLAIPREPAPAPPSAPRAAEPAPVDAAKLEAFRAYRSRHLSVRHYSGVAMGTVVAGGYGYGFGYGYGAMQTAYPYYYPVQGWGVFQGPVRLQTLDYLGLVQDVATRQRVQQRVRRNQVTGYSLFAVGVAGIAGTIVAGTGASNARTLAELQQWRTVGTVSTLGLLGGFIGGSFPLSKARRLLNQPGLSVPRADIDQQVSDFNEGLRNELGLTPAEVLSIENAAPN